VTDAIMFVLATGKDRSVPALDDLVSTNGSQAVDEFGDRGGFDT
jgi:hypothetical protein